MTKWNLIWNYCGWTAGFRSSAALTGSTGDRAVIARPNVSLLREQCFLAHSFRGRSDTRLLQPAEYGFVPRYGLGLTDLAKTVLGSDTALQEHFDPYGLRAEISTIDIEPAGDITMCRGHGAALPRG